MGPQNCGGRSSGEYGRLYAEARLPPSPGPLVAFCGCVHGSPVCDEGLVIVSCPLLQTSEEIFQHLQNIVDFGKNVMKEFLGENYVHCGVSVLFCF